MKKKPPSPKGKFGPAANAWKGGKRLSNLRKHLKRKGVEFTEELLAFHESVTHCPICGVELEVGIGARAKHFDHDHQTGKYRGTICNSCNLGLGMAYDNPDILRKMIAYLEDAQIGRKDAQIRHEEKRA